MANGLPLDVDVYIEILEEFMQSLSLELSDIQKAKNKIPTLNRDLGFRKIWWGINHTFCNGDDNNTECLHIGQDGNNYGAFLNIS